jgi:outer membrane receptor protein involved in Fe transport
MSNSKVLPYGKIRVSWAQVGADAPIYALQNYFTQGVFNDGWTSGIAFPLPNKDGETFNGYTYSATLGNSTLKPEKTNSFEVGTELRFVKQQDWCRFHLLSI